MIPVIEQYEEFTENLPRLIRESYYKAEFFLEKLNLKHANYYRKLKDKNFTVAEVKIITQILFPEQILMNNLKKSKEDILAGNVEKHNDFMERLRVKYNI